MEKPHAADVLLSGGTPGIDDGDKTRALVQNQSRIEGGSSYTPRPDSSFKSGNFVGAAAAHSLGIHDCAGQGRKLHVKANIALTMAKLVTRHARRFTARGSRIRRACSWFKRDS